MDQKIAIIVVQIYILGLQTTLDGLAVFCILIASGALMGVVSALIKFCGVECYLGAWAASNGAALVGVAAYVALIVYFICASKKVK